MFHTLEKFERINRQLNLHQQAEEPDIFAVEQFQAIKDDLVQQLQRMLAALELPFQIPVAA